MFQALLCPSSGARDYDVVYIGRVVRGLLYVGGYVQLGWSGVRVEGSSCRLEPATRTPLQPNCTLPPTYSKPRTTRLMC